MQTTENDNVLDVCEHTAHQRRQYPDYRHAQTKHVQTRHPFLAMRAELWPLARYPKVALISCAFLFSAFLLLLLVALSLPILKSIYLVQLTSKAVERTPLSIATTLRFGVWGVCASRYNSLSFLSHGLTNFDSSTLGSTPDLCFGPMLGYDVPEYFSAALKVSQSLVQAVEKGLLAILILHPIAAGLATASFLTSLFLASHAFSIFSLILTIITAVLSSVLFVIDLVLVLVANANVKNLRDLKVSVSFGNAVWLILVAVVFCWAAVITLSARACFCMGVRK